jgi:hypothetical protein
MTPSNWAAKQLPEDARPFRFYEAVGIQWSSDGGRSLPHAVLTNGQMRGTFPPPNAELDPANYVSRQVRRAAIRAERFTLITQAAYALPRRERRRLSRTMEN